MTECFLRSVDQLFQALSTDCPEYQLTGGRGGRGGRGCPHSIDQLTLRTQCGNDIIKNLEDPDMYTSVTSHRMQVVIEKVSKLVESKKQILSAGYEDAWNVNGDNARDHEGVAMLEQLSKMKTRLEDGGKEFVLALEGVSGYDSTDALLRGTRLARDIGEINIPASASTAVINRCSREEFEKKKRLPGICIDLVVTKRR